MSIQIWMKEVVIHIYNSDFAGLWLSSLSSAPSFRRYAINSLIGPLRKQVLPLNFMYLQTLCRNSCGTNVLLFFSIFLLDEYILPKIAERSLRRFAVLQSSSIEVGLNLPLHKVHFFLSLQVICWLLSSSLKLTSFNP